MTKNTDYLYGSKSYTTGVAGQFYRAVLKKYRNNKKAAAYRHFCECVSDETWTSATEKNILLMVTSQFVYERATQLDRYKDFAHEAYKNIVFECFYNWYCDWCRHRQTKYVANVIRNTESFYDHESNDEPTTQEYNMNKAAIQKDTDAEQDSQLLLATDAISNYMLTASMRERRFYMYLTTGQGVKFIADPITHAKQHKVNMGDETFGYVTFFTRLKTFKEKLAVVAAKAMSI